MLTLLNNGSGAIEKRDCYQKDVILNNFVKKGF